MNTNKEMLTKIGIEAKNIGEKGYYINPKGNKVEIKQSIEQMINGTILYTPKDGFSLLERLKGKNHYDTIFEVRNETTLSASKVMLNEGYERVGALNFASAKNPGGGFLKGSSAQEESLARSSALYASISIQREMYETNKKNRSCLYTDYMIYSPDVPVFRNDNGELLEVPYLVSFFTSPAVNAGEIRKNERHISQAAIDSVMKKRIEKILAVALDNGHHCIVLGAFGCGVFKNHPKTVAGYFKDILTKNPRFKNQFKKVVFAVLDTSENQLIYKSFTDLF